MKFICPKDILVDKINTVLKTVSPRSTMKAYECILIDVLNEAFIMTTNDGEMGTKTSPYGVNAERPGKVALDAKLFSDIIRKMPEGDIIVDTDYNFVTVISNSKVEFKIVGIDADEFPALPEYEKDISIKVKTSDLKTILKKTIFSISQDNSKPAYMGALFEAQEGFLNVVSIDGFRISFTRIKLEENVDFSVLVPGKALNELIKILPDDEDLKIYISKSRVVFETDSFTFTTRLLDGSFLDYKRSFISDYKTKVFIKTDKFISCLERSLLISSEIKRQPVYLKFDNNILSLTSQTENGSLYDEIGIDMEGPSVDIAFNPRYLLEPLKAADEEELIIMLTSSLTACIIKSENNEDYKFLVLPLRTKY